MNSKVFRKKVEVLLFKNGKLCLCLKGLHRPWVNYPGGGVDPGESLEEAAKRECLEEVGVLIKDITKLEIVHRYPYPSGQMNLKGQSGTEVFYLAALYDKVDLRIYDKEDDGRKYSWLSPKEVSLKLSNNDFDKGRREALDFLLGSKDIASLYT